MIRFLMVALMAVPATVYYAARIFLAVYMGSDRAVCVCREAPRRWCKLLLRTAGVRVVVENEGVIDADAMQVVVANHVSWFDVLALAAYTPGPYVFVAKKELQKAPLFGRAVRACGHIFIDRQDRTRALESLGEARQRLEDDRPSIIMFPEGTRSADGSLMRFKKGAFVLAIQTGADVIPTAIFGSRDVMKKGSFRIRSGVIRVRFGVPISVDGLTSDDRNELTEKAWNSLSELQANYTLT